MPVDTDFCTLPDAHPDEWVVRSNRQVHDWRNRDGMIKRALVERFLHAYILTATVSEPETVEKRFHRLADEWSRDTQHISSVNDLVKDERYQQIINMGWDVLPYLLSDLETRKRFWFPALAAITDLRPFDRKDSGNYKLMTEAWIRWGRLRGLI